MVSTAREEVRAIKRRVFSDPKHFKATLASDVWWRRRERLAEINEMLKLMWEEDRLFMDANLAKKVEDGKIEKILTIGLGAKDVDALRRLAEGQHTKNYAVIVRRLIQKAAKS